MTKGDKFDLENAVIRALGLSGQPIRKVVLTLEYDKLPQVEVTIDRWSAEPDKLDTMVVEFKRYELVEKS